MNHARILLTGSTGFVGRHLYQHFAPKYKLLCVNRSHQSQPSQSISFNDLFSDNGWKQIRAFAPTHLIHCAAIAHRRPPLSSEGRRRLVSVNIELPVLLARMAIELGIHRYLFLSSIGVHGSCTHGSEVISESSPLSPTNSYSRSKITAEKKLQQIHAGTATELTILRPALVYGQGNPGNLSKLIQAIDYGIPLPLASVVNRRSFIAIENLTSVIEHTLFHSCAGGKTFVVADSETISTPALLQVIASARGRRLRMFSAPNGVLSLLRQVPYLGDKLNQLVEDLVVDSTTIRSELAWHQPFSQDQAMLRAFL